MTSADDEALERWRRPFTRQEAEELFARMVSGWANRLDESGSRTLIDGVTMPSLPDVGGSFEGLARMMWGFGGWLSQPGRPTTVTYRGVTYDLAAFARRGMANACDPSCIANWGQHPIPGGWDQRTVEAGNTMFNLWQARESVWNQMTPTERENIVRYHDIFSQRPAYWGTNWALFWMLNHASRKALGERYDQAIIDSVLDEYIEGVYVGDGWYDDGPVRGGNHFDDYNWWVFGTHQLCWMMVDGASRPEKSEQIRERIRLLMNHYPYFFAANGAYSEYGRSLAYKFARLGAPLYAYRMGAWPHSPGMLKRLVGRHVRWYFDRGGVRGDGTLRQSLTYQGTESIRDPYISTGSTYWAMQAFGGLWTLPDDDPFWTAEEEPLPVEQGDFVKVFSQPGWIAAGTQKSGHVQRFIAGSTHHGTGYQATYHKYVYSTVAPFNAGLAGGSASPDAMLCLTDGKSYAHRQNLLASAVGEPGWLRLAYSEFAAGQQHQIDTTILVLGEVHLRAHRVRLHPETKRPISAVEGAAALGYSPGMHFEQQIGEPGEPTSVSVPVGVDRATCGRAVAVLPLRGYDEQSITTSWLGHPNLNSVYREYAMPFLETSRVQPVHEFVCLVHIGADDYSGLLAAGITGVSWLDDDTLRITWQDGSTLEIPPLAQQAD